MNTNLYLLIGIFLLSHLAGARCPPMQDKIAEYGNYISLLNTHDLNTIKLAVERYREVVDSSDKVFCDSAFWVFWQYFNAVKDSQAAGLEKEGGCPRFGEFADVIDYPANPDENALKEKLETDNQTYRQADLSLLEQLNAFGLKIECVEGFICVASGKADYIVKNFSGYVSEPTRNYVELVINDENKPVAKDAGLQISVRELAGRAIQWETFIRDNPGFVKIEECKQKYHDCLHALMSGFENTPAFDFETHILKSEFRNAYDFIRKESSGTQTGKIIQGYYELLISRGFVSDTTIQEYIKKSTRYDQQ